MNKKTSYAIIICCILLLMFAAPVFALFCPNCGTKNADTAKFCIKCGAKLPAQTEVDNYTKACNLYEAEEYDQVITLVGDYCNQNPVDYKFNTILAKAYLEKCEIMKENGNKKYEDLVLIPWNIGKRLYSVSHSPESLYICAKAQNINGRPTRAKKYIKKIMDESDPSKPNFDYYILYADIEAGLSIQEKMLNSNYFDYFGVKEKYEDVINMDITDDERALAYYKLAVYLKPFGQSKMALEALDSAAKLASKDSLKMRIKRRQDDF